MVTTTTINQVEGMQVDKPDANSGQNIDSENKSILLVCRKDGKYLADGNELPNDDAIKQAIAEKLKENPGLQGIVQCDQSAEVGAMVHLIDLLREAGVKKYAIATEKPQPEN